MRTMIQTRWICQECGAICVSWVRRCQECGGWDTFLEERARGEAVQGKNGQPLQTSAIRFPSIRIPREKRLQTGLEAFDRVVGGGILAGSVLLIGGDPGIGKSTLVLRVCDQIAERTGPVLYASGEESIQQIALRGRRIGVASQNLFILHETSLEHIFETADALRPTVVALDSIQMVASASLDTAAGTVGQLREATIRCVLYAKHTGRAIVLIGHVAKDGSLAGPKSLEHLVDVVLYVEGGASREERALRASKNRFGVMETGMFIL